MVGSASEVLKRCAAVVAEQNKHNQQQNNSHAPSRGDDVECGDSSKSKSAAKCKVQRKVNVLLSDEYVMYTIVCEIRVDSAKMSMIK